MSSQSSERLFHPPNAFPQRLIARPTRELQRANDQLYLNQRSLQAIYDALPLAAVVFEITPDGDVVYASVNRGFANDVGLHPDEIIGKHPREVMKPWPQLEADFGRNFKLCVETQQTVAYEQYFIDPDGRELWYLIQLSPLVDDQGQVTHLVGAAQQITARKQAEIALVQAKESAEAAGQARSNFLASVGHELRTPLNAIMGFSKLLNRDSSLPPEQLQYTETITRNAERLLVLINDVLDMAKIETNRVKITPTFFDLHRLLTEVNELFYAAALEKGLKLNLLLDDDLPQQIRTDPIKLRHVLLNLLSNAIKFTEAGSITLHVSGKNYEAESRSEDNQHALLCSPNFLLHFVLSDTGPGFAPEEMDELLTPFTQAGRSRLQAGGTGLGLPLSRSYIALLGGELKVESKLNQGTTFWFDLPVDIAVPDRFENEKTDLPRQVLKTRTGQPNHRLLVIDEEAVTRQLLVGMLQPLGLEIRTVANGQNALDGWPAWQPQLVFLSTRLLTPTSQKIARQIRERATSPVVIVALTTGELSQSQHTAMTSTYDDILCVPFSFRDILALLDQHLPGLKNDGSEEQAALSAPPAPVESSDFTERRPDQSFFAPEEKMENGVLQEGLSWSNPAVEFTPLRSQVANLNPGLIANLHQAAIDLDGERLRALLLTVRDQNEELARSLLTLIDNFAYDELFSLTSSVGEE
ncbi:MAG TPA: ATP-binding protein [Anaerolineae bacterium]|nr:ATP-binding protein [Anaerolineae bacterium]HMR62854.1 ATP-binding protein [Anaerolineae bacterium]